MTPMAFSLDLAPGKSLFGLLCVFAHILVVSVCFNPFHTADDISGSQHQSANDQLLDGVGVGTWRIENNDALLCTFIKRDIVYSCAGSCDGAQADRKVHLLHIGGAYEHAVGVVNGIRKDIPVAEVIGPGLADIVQAVDLSVLHLLFASNSFINSTRAVTPSIGIAL